jgi:holo-[acyl-carrier-protein] synthase
MKILGIGTDIVEIKRLKEARYLERVASFLFTPKEMLVMEKSRNKVEFVASRLAAKESIIKAFPGTLHYHDFEIGKRGKKLTVDFTDLKHAKYHVFVSIAHEFTYAIGYAIVSL